MKFQKHTRALIVDVNLMWFQYLSLRFDRNYI